METKTQEEPEVIINENQIKIVEEMLNNMTQEERVARVRKARAVLAPVMEYCKKRWPDSPHSYNIGAQPYIKQDWFLIFFDTKKESFVIKKYEKGSCPPFVTTGWFGKKQYAKGVLEEFSGDILEYLEYYPWSPDFI